jgi:hypothetical protein
LKKKILWKEIGVFLGGFAISTVFMVAKTWFHCGEMRGKRGPLAVIFCGAKNTPDFGTLFLGLSAGTLSPVHQLDQQNNDDDGQDGQQGDAALDPPSKRCNILLQASHPLIILADGEACAFDLFRKAGDLGALVLKLPVESHVSFGDLAKVAANSFGHGCHRRFVRLL